MSSMLGIASTAVTTREDLAWHRSETLSGTGETGGVSTAAALHCHAQGTCALHIRRVHSARSLQLKFDVTDVTWMPPRTLIGAGQLGMARQEVDFTCTPKLHSTRLFTSFLQAPDVRHDTCTVQSYQMPQSSRQKPTRISIAVHPRDPCFFDRSPKISLAVIFGNRRLEFCRSL